MSIGDTHDLGAESLLGVDAEGQLAQDVRDRLALATRYLANFYRATKDSEEKDVWWQRIDAERVKVERAYTLAGAPGNESFLGVAARAAYADAARDWPQLWRDLKLSPDTLIEQSLIDRAAGIIEAPLAWLPTFSETLAKSLGDSLGGIARQLAPWLLVAGLAGGVYVLRKPIAAAISRLGS